jgi:hypothetical protein
MLRLVPVSIVLAGAALEANANEIIQDLLDDQTLKSDQRDALQSLKGDLSGNSVEKYKILSEIMLNNAPDAGNLVWENALCISSNSGIASCISSPPGIMKVPTTISRQAVDDLGTLVGHVERPMAAVRKLC